MNTRSSLRRWLTPLLLAGVCAALLAGGALLSRELFETPDERPAPQRTPAPAPRPSSVAPSAFQVASVEGKVEVFREGKWVPIREKEVLTLQDVVRTSPGAQAVLRLGTRTVTLRERVDLRLDSISGFGASVNVLKGKVVAQVADSGETLVIMARETRSSNEGAANFAVQVTEHGRVNVSSTQGTARFAAQGKEVRVTAGTESSAEPGSQPSDPQKIPEEVLLSVVWPELENTERVVVWPPPEKPRGSGDRLQVKGKTRPGTDVKVNGVPAEISPDGRFSVVVPAREGSKLEVQAEDLQGRTRTVTKTLKRKGGAGPSLDAFD